MKISQEQFLWLYQRNRGMEDLEEDDIDGLYVWMSNGAGGEVKVYLPDKKTRRKGLQIIN